LHLAPDAWGKTEVTSAALVRAPGLALVFDGVQQPRLETGWYAPQYGVKVPAPVVSVAVEGVRTTRFLTLVAPLAPSDAAPTLRTGSAGVVEVTTHHGRDLVAWDGDGAAAAWLRESRDGEPLAFRACRARGGWIAWDRGGRVTRGKGEP
jgi:hypothetical protein